MDTAAGEKLIGQVTHYYSRLQVGIVELTGGALRVGDTIRIKGKHTDFVQTVDSIQVEHRDVDRADQGQVVGIKVKEKVREHDQVFLA
jgi:putative protease